MTILADFQIVTTGGNFSSGKAFTKTFPTGGRCGAGFLGFLLMEWLSFPEQWDKPAYVKFYVNGHWIATLPVVKGTATKILRLGEENLFSTKQNTFKALAFNAWGGFENVVCHYHQKS